MKFYLRSILLGAGLAMDASAVSMANGLKEPKMPLTKSFLIAFMFGLFQALMPLIGYFIGHAFLNLIAKYIPWIALVLLSIVGGSMVIGGFKNSPQEEIKNLGFVGLLTQAIATSIDALTIGFTIADYTIANALICCSIIALVTFSLCMIGIYIGKKFGTKLGAKSEIIGGLILIGIGLEIFISSF